MTYLKLLGFRPLNLDLGVFIKGKVFIVIYVNNLLITRPTLLEITTLKVALVK